MEKQDCCGECRRQGQLWSSLPLSLTESLIGETQVQNCSLADSATYERFGNESVP